MPKAKKTIELEKKLTQLLGKESYTCTKKSCTGKWAGTYDHSMIFNDGSCYFVSNGMKLYHHNLEKFIGQVEFFIANRDKLSEWIKEVLKVNDVKTNPVKNVFDRLYLITDDTYFGRPAFDFHTEENGRLIESFKFLESSFCSYCLGWKYESYIEIQMKNGFNLDFGTKTILYHPELFI